MKRIMKSEKETKKWTESLRLVTNEPLHFTLFFHSIRHASSNHYECVTKYLDMPLNVNNNNERVALLSFGFDLSIKINHKRTGKERFTRQTLDLTWCMFYVLTYMHWLSSCVSKVRPSLSLDSQLSGLASCLASYNVVFCFVSLLSLYLCC